MVEAGGWRLEVEDAGGASGLGGGHALVPTTCGGDERTLGAHLAWWRLGKGGGAEDAGGASGLGGGRLRTLGAHLASGGGHALVPGDMLE
jgi:hypothetical protein